MPRPRRTRHHDRITFALDDGVDDLGAGEAPGLPAPPPGADRTPVGSTTPTAEAPTEAAADTADAATTATPRRRRLRAALATAGVAAIVVGGMVVVDAVASRPAVETLRRSPGGVEPLPDAPAELWSATAPHRGGLATLPGLVVLVTDDEATAYDLDTGQARWSAPVPAGSTCGDPFRRPENTGVPDDTVVCLTVDGPVLTTMSPTGLPNPGPPTLTPGGPAVVTVLDADGTVVATRTLDAARGWSSTGPDGTVARFRRVGGDLGGRLVEVDPATGRPADRSDGLAAVVTLEDAVTGAVRWEHELPFVASDGDGGCTQYGTPDGATYADLDGGRVTRQGGLLVAHGCGVEAWFTPDGTRVDDPATPADGLDTLPDGSLARDPEGSWNSTWSVTGPSPTPAVLDPDGTVRWVAPGRILAPLTTDGTADELVLVQESADLVAYDSSGTPLWTSRAANSPTFVHAVAGGTVVAHRSMDDAVVGIDAATGRELWVLTPQAIRALDEGRSRNADGVLAMDLWIDQVLTDGTRALVVVTSGVADTSRLVAVGLRDAQVAWRGDTTTRSVTYLAVQGRLLRVDDSTVVRLG